MNTVTYKMLFSAEADREISQVERMAILDALVGEMNSYQIRDWINASQYSRAIAQGVDDHRKDQA